MVHTSIFDFQKVRKIRLSRNLSRNDVAKNLDVSITTIKKLETTERETNNLFLMNQLAILFDCYLDDFLKDGLNIF